MLKLSNDVVLKDYVEGLEMTVLSGENAVLLDGMVGTSGSTGNNCQCNGNNCQCAGNNCSCTF